MQQRIDRGSDRAWYRQFADILRAQITSGRWEPGRYLPSEYDLGSDYGVSQITVRRALGVLRAEGLVEASRGLPWQVRERREVTVMLLQPGDRVGARIATPDDHERYDIPEGVPVLVISRKGRRDRVVRADEVVAEVPDPASEEQ